MNPVLSPFTTSQQLTQKARAALDVGRPKEAIPLLLQALDGQAVLLQMAAGKRIIPLEKGGLVHFAFCITLFFNGLPLLLRGLWNAGVWVFHATGHG